MAIAFNQKSGIKQPAEPGVLRQQLLTDERVKGTDVLLDRVTLAEGVTIPLKASETSWIWMHLLAGEARLETARNIIEMSDAHSAFLPPAFPSTLTTGPGATCSTPRSSIPRGSTPRRSIFRILRSPTGCAKPSSSRKAMPANASPRHR